MRIVPEFRRAVKLGDVFCFLTVSGIPFYATAGNAKSSEQHVVCQCRCGVNAVCLVKSIRAGLTKSCGCLNRSMLVDRAKTMRDSWNGRHPGITHGESKTRIHKIWVGMRQRCFNRNNQDYVHYGERGISICDEWSSFSAFSRWAKDSGYSAELEIDRIDNNGNYEPSNCRWVSHAVQVKNTRANRKIAAFGETKTIGEWARDDRCCVGRCAIAHRIDHQGMSPDLAISTGKYQA